MKKVVIDFNPADEYEKKIASSVMEIIEANQRYEALDVEDNRSAVIKSEQDLACFLRKYPGEMPKIESPEMPNRLAKLGWRYAFTFHPARVHYVKKDEIITSSAIAIAKRIYSFISDVFHHQSEGILITKGDSLIYRGWISPFIDYSRLKKVSGTLMFTPFFSLHQNQDIWLTQISLPLTYISSDKINGHPSITRLKRTRLTLSPCIFGDNLIVTHNYTAEPRLKYGTDVEWSGVPYNFFHPDRQNVTMFGFSVNGKNIADYKITIGTELSNFRAMEMGIQVENDSLEEMLQKPLNKVRHELREEKNLRELMPHFSLPYYEPALVTL